MADSVSKSGIWVDSKTGKVVESEPEQGFQMVPKGGEITPLVQSQLDQLRAPTSAPAGPVDLSVQEPAARPVTVEPERPTRRK